MGFWCCVVVPKTALLFIPLLIYIWNRFLEPIWSNYWKSEEKLQMEIQTEDVSENSSVSKESCCDKKSNVNAVTNDSIREKIE